MGRWNGYNGRSGRMPPPRRWDLGPKPEMEYDIQTELRRVVCGARLQLLSKQSADGYWQGELEGDGILQSETILVLTFFGKERSPLAEALAKRLLDTQLPEGGWSLYPGGRAEISASVKAYFALKLTGHDPASEPLQRAREMILSLGGAERVNSFTRFYLAMLGQIPYSLCPAVPPELLLLPSWSPVHLHALSAWSRTMVVPLSVIWAKKPVRFLPGELGIRELILHPPEQWPPIRKPGETVRHGFGWGAFFRGIDRLYKAAERRGLLPGRQRALRAAQEWMLRRIDAGDGLGAIYPPIVWSLIALDALGVSPDDPAVRKTWRQLERLVIEDERGTRVQPCLSPVWDTAISLRALYAAGVDGNCAAVRKAVAWLIDKQITVPGDWAETVPAEPGGWCFEHRNDFYPDCDDTAMVLMALHGFVNGTCNEQFPRPFALIDEQAGRSQAGRPRPGTAEEEDLLGRATGAIHRGLNWLLAMQNDDGGWAAFDRNNCRRFLCHVPFADHNAMIDPSAPDLTGRVLEALGTLGRRLGCPEVDRAVRYLRRSQEPDGSWFGRWGVNYVYGTWQALTGLRAVGVPEDDPAVQAGAEWLITHQHADGGWGELPDTYDHPERRGRGPATPSQTAWAVMGLIAAGKQSHRAVLQGVRFLLDHWSPEEGWDEPYFTGTGFPRVFYLRYHLYALYFPMMALAKFAALAQHDPPPFRSRVRVVTPADPSRQNLRTA